MKKLICGGLKCDMTVSPKFSFFSVVPCSYGRETIAYAVRRFFPRNKQLCRECVYLSWSLRFKKGKSKKLQKKFLIPARAMQLPGTLVRVEVEIDQMGVCVKKVELLAPKPFDWGKPYGKEI